MTIARSHGEAVRAIHEGVARWAELIKTKDADGIAELYSGDAVAMPPNHPIVSGQNAIRMFWRSTVQVPELSLTFEAENIHVAESGDLAIDRGIYRLSGKSDGQSFEDRGKYVEVWRRIGTEWKVAANIYNSDKPEGNS